MSVEAITPDQLVINPPQNQSNISNTSSPNKNRRRRRKNNKNKNNNINTNKSQTKPTNPKQSNKKKSKNKTKIYSTTTTNPWQKTKVKSKLTNIMKKQSNTQSSNQNNIFLTNELTETDLLEQQMILEAIAESNKHKSQPFDDEKKSNIKTLIDDSNNINNINNNLQTMNDEMLALYLQKEEQKSLLRKQKLSERHDGKYAKVTSSSVHPTTHTQKIDKSALQFYYDDNKVQKPSEESIIENENENDTNIGDPNELISKHDPKIWSETHMNRLNEYEAGGNLDIKMQIGNQCYNAFRNQLDKKGYVNYNTYQLQPKDKKR